MARVASEPTNKRHCPVEPKTGAIEGSALRNNTHISRSQYAVWAPRKIRKCTWVGSVCGPSTKGAAVRRRVPVLVLSLLKGHLAVLAELPKLPEVVYRPNLSSQVAQPHPPRMDRRTHRVADQYARDKHNSELGRAGAGAPEKHSAAGTHDTSALYHCRSHTFYTIG